MSEIYLTKIERKTIFTKSLIFVLIMFIISDLTVTGPFWFNFIPWLYIVGTVGSIKKIDGVLMGIIGTFTVFISSLITYSALNLACIIDTIIALISLVLGIITGKCVYEFILEHRLVKYIRRSKKTVYILSIIVMLLVSWTMVSYNNGNVITYLNSRSNLNEYISETYNGQEYRLIKSKYIKNIAGKYIHTVEMDSTQVVFAPVTNKTFKDIDKDIRRIQMTRAVNEQLETKCQELKKTYNLIQDANVQFELEYNNVQIIPGTLSMYIKWEKPLKQTEDMDKVYEQVASYINHMNAEKQLDKVVVTMKDKTLNITMENIQNLTAEYIQGGFEIKEINE